MVAAISRALNRRKKKRARLDALVAIGHGTREARADCGVVHGARLPRPGLAGGPPKHPCARSGRAPFQGSADACTKKSCCSGVDDHG